MNDKLPTAAQAGEVTVVGKLEVDVACSRWTYLEGFPVTGVLPDSQVFRPQPEACSEEDFWSRDHDTMTTSGQSTSRAAVDSTAVMGALKGRHQSRLLWQAHDPRSAAR